MVQAAVSETTAAIYRIMCDAQVLNLLLRAANENTTRLLTLHLEIEHETYCSRYAKERQ
jgi:hypothetical protein